VILKQKDLATFREELYKKSEREDHSFLFKIKPVKECFQNHQWLLKKKYCAVVDCRAEFSTNQ